MLNTKLTQPQRDLLLMLDGRIIPLELDGTYKRTCTSLKAKGFITFRETTKHIRFGPARGSHMWNTARKVIVPTLTTEGADFIFNGGLDK